jgi:hypothetical protein
MEVTSYIVRMEVRCDLCSRLIASRESSPQNHTTWTDHTELRAAVQVEGGRRIVLPSGVTLEVACQGCRGAISARLKGVEPVDADPEVPL